MTCINDSLCSQVCYVMDLVSRVLTGLAVKRQCCHLHGSPLRDADIIGVGADAGGHKIYVFQCDCALGLHCRSEVVPFFCCEGHQFHGDVSAGLDSTFNEISQIYIY